MISWETVAPGIERLSLRTPTLPPASETNSYLVEGRDGFFVIEPATPYAKERAILFEQVQARISRGEMLLGALVTHHHVDHVGAAESFRTEFGVPLYGHIDTRRLLSQRVAVDRLIEEGEKLPGTDVRALHTPGHAPGHICLWSETGKWLVAGDMVASVGTIVIDPDDEGDMADYIAQLARMMELGATRMLPAHGDPIDDPNKLLAYYIAHRAEREAKVLAAVRDGERDAKGVVSLGEVVRRAYADTPAWLWPLAAKSARAHLAKLVGEGVVEVKGDGWK
jgi:glyoxylase-like metal-dependent hydrolase (beta-lactamase superfamily II)